MHAVKCVHVTSVRSLSLKNILVLSNCFYYLLWDLLKCLWDHALHRMHFCPDIATYIVAIDALIEGHFCGHSWCDFLTFVLHLRPLLYVDLFLDGIYIYKKDDGKLVNLQWFNFTQYKSRNITCSLEVSNFLMGWCFLHMYDLWIWTFQTWCGYLSSK